MKTTFLAIYTQYHSTPLLAFKLYLDITQHTLNLKTSKKKKKKKHEQEPSPQRKVSRDDSTQYLQRFKLSSACQAHLNDCLWDVANPFPSCLAVIHMIGQLMKT